MRRRGPREDPEPEPGTRITCAEAASASRRATRLNEELQARAEQAAEALAQEGHPLFQREEVYEWGTGPLEEARSRGELGAGRGGLCGEIERAHGGGAHRAAKGWILLHPKQIKQGDNPKLGTTSPWTISR